MTVNGASRRKICVVTGSRAEYGCLRSLLRGIADDRALELQLVVTGAHLSPEFGLTYKTIENDGFKINAKVEMLLSSDTPVGIAKATGLGLIGFADALQALKPDLMAVFGDRYEMLSAAQAAMMARIPLAHLHGGEATEGLVDEAIRHSLTKMSHLHFVAAEPYRKRVIQMGEHPDRVFNFGAPGLDQVASLKLLERTALERELSFKLGEKTLVVTYHPVTLREGGTESAMRALFAALDRFADAKIVFTKSNADADGRVIGAMIDEYVARQPSRAAAFVSLGQLRYFSLISHAQAVVGNSSSGIVEVPSLKKPTVNLGDRQRGRICADSVINCTEDESSIVSAVERALSPDFQAVAARVRSPYGGDGATGAKIVECLKNHALGRELLMKRFHDL